MCLEDIRIMRQSSGTIHSIAIPATAGLVLSPSPDRIGIFFLPNDAGNYWVSTDSEVAVGQGMEVSPTSGPIYLDVFKHGDFCRRGWFAIGEGGAMTAAIGELLLPDTLTRNTGYGKP